MRRVLTLGFVVSIGAVSLLAYQPPPPQPPMVIEVEKVTDNLFILKGGGGNTAVYVGADRRERGRREEPRLGQADFDKIKELTLPPSRS
jgi:hypothetical protein